MNTIIKNDLEKLKEALKMGIAAGQITLPDMACKPFLRAIDRQGAENKELKEYRQEILKALRQRPDVITVGDMRYVRELRRKNER